MSLQGRSRKGRLFILSNQVTLLVMILKDKVLLRAKRGNPSPANVIASEAWQSLNLKWNSSYEIATSLRSSQ
jgi:hypothetical protein